MLQLCQSDLAHYLAGRGALSEREAAHITQQLLMALLTCHRHGVAYRDVKPANLLVRSIDANGLPEVCLAGARLVPPWVGLSFGTICDIFACQQLTPP